MSKRCLATAFFIGSVITPFIYSEPLASRLLSDLQTPCPFQKNRSMKLEKCLAEVYRLDAKQIATISSLLDSIEDQSLVDAFIVRSNAVCLTPVTQQKLSVLQEDDAVIKAPHSHQVLFENPHLRILDVSVKPGETVPPHRHQWGCVMIILQGSKFKMVDSEGNVSEEEDYEPLVGKFERDEKPLSYTNIGQREFRALSFEIKD